MEIQLKRVGKLVKPGAVFGEQREVLLAEFNNTFARRPVEGEPGLAQFLFECRVQHELSVPPLSAGIVFSHGHPSTKCPACMVCLHPPLLSGVPTGRATGLPVCRQSRFCAARLPSLLARWNPE